MNTARRDRWLVAAGVVLMLVALVVVGRLQGRNLPEGDAAVSQPTTGTVPPDAAPVASGLAVAGRVVLPGPAAAVAVGEDAVWVLLGQGTLLRVDPDRHQVTGRLELGAPTGPLAVGAGAVGRPRGADAPINQSRVAHHSACPDHSPRGATSRVYALSSGAQVATACFMGLNLHL